MRDNALCYESFCEEDTYEIGKSIGNGLKAGDILCLTGEIGTGKTAFTKGIANALGVIDYVISPTFTIVNEYFGRHNLYHFDVYRINDIDEIFETGFEDYIYGQGITVIEWAEMISEILPPECIWVRIEKNLALGEAYRKISLNK